MLETMSLGRAVLRLTRVLGTAVVPWMLVYPGGRLADDVRCAKLGRGHGTWKGRPKKGRALLRETVDEGALTSNG